MTAVHKGAMPAFTKCPASIMLVTNLAAKLVNAVANLYV
jgi:hypothetical protein